jgi:hypothetical protein
MFDALEVGFKGTENEDLIDRLYAGRMIDYLRCLDVDYETEREDKFLDISVAIIPFGGTVACKTLMECVEMYLRPEILDGANKYRVEEKNTHSDAIKGLKIFKLPQILSVHLKRFVFDFSGINVTQKKLNDIVKFPFVLDMNRYVGRRKAKQAGDTEGQSAHSQEAIQGGEDEFELFLQEQMASLRQKRSPVNSSAGMVDIEKCSLGSADPTPEAAGDDDTRYEEMLAYRTDDIPRLIQTRGEWIYELYAVLIHSGSSYGGHYYAYVKDLDSKRWWNFNDSSVSEMKEDEVKVAWGSNYSYSSTSYGAGSSSYSSSSYSYGGTNYYSGSSSAKSLSSANGYMLMYRKASCTEKLPTAEEVPDYIRTMISGIEAEAERKRKEDEERRSRMTVKLYYGGPSESGSSSYTNKALQMSVKKSDTYLTLLRTVWGELKLSNDQRFKNQTDNALASDGKPIETPTNETLASIMRIRDYNIHSKALGVPYDVTVKGSLSLDALYFNEYREYVVETKLPTEEWPLWHVDGLSLKVNVYDQKKNAFLTSTVRVPKGATVRDLSRIVKEQAKGELHRVRLMKIEERYNTNLYEGRCLQSDQRLKEDLYLYDNHILYAEEDDDENAYYVTEKSSRCVSYLALLKTMMDIKINRPPSNEFTETVAVYASWTHSRFRSEVAATLNLKETEFKLNRYSIHGPEIKYGDETKMSTYFHQGAYQRNVLVSLGEPSVEGCMSIKTAFFQPKRRPKWDNPVGSATSVTYQPGTGGVYFLPAELGEVEAAPVTVENLIDTEDIVPTQKSIALFSGDDDDEDSTNPGYTSAKVESVSKDDAQIFVVADARYTSGSETSPDHTPLADTCELFSKETVASAVEDDDTPELVDIPTTKRRMSANIQDELQHKVSLRKVAEVKSSDDSEPEQSVKLREVAGEQASPSRRIAYASSDADFTPLSLNISVRKDMTVESLRALAFERLRRWDEEQASKSSSYTSFFSAVHADPSYLRITQNVYSAWSNPGTILRDGPTLGECLGHQLYDGSRLLFQLREVPESLPPRKAGDVVVYVQRWYRSTWTMGPRREVYLRGSMKISDIGRHLAAMFDINVNSLKAYQLDRHAKDLAMFKLAEKLPGGYYSSKVWFDPQIYKASLKDSKGIQVMEGDLLILQDDSEVLQELTDDLRATMQIEDDDLNVSHTVYIETGKTNRYKSGGGGGVKIKTHKDRQDELNSKAANNTTNQDGDSSSHSPVYGPVQSDADSKDDSEFMKQGGSEQMKDMMGFV